MGLLETLHNEHKARRQRIKAAAYIPPTVEIRKISEIKKDIVGLKLRPSLDVILHELCRYYDIRPEDILSTRRQAKIAEKRQILMFLANRMTMMTNPQIAERLDRDPTTIWYAIDKITSNLDKYRADLDKLEDLIRTAFQRENIPCLARKTPSNL